MDNREGQEKSTPQLIEALKFAREILHDQVERFHKDCRCQLCESCLPMIDQALRSVAGGEPPKMLCGRNIGNDQVVIPCGLDKWHDGPCERNIQSVVAGVEPTYEYQIGPNGRPMSTVRQTIQTAGGEPEQPAIRRALREIHRISTEMWRRGPVTKESLQGQMEEIVSLSAGVLSKLPAPPQGKP